MTIAVIFLLLLKSLIVHCFFWYRIVKSYLVTKGDEFSTEIVKQEADLSPEMIQR